MSTLSLLIIAACEKGGVYVVANIRGGREFDPNWHQAALKAKRHRAYEDFAAVAEAVVPFTTNCQ
jgi:prolyl oligopeptidase